MLLPAAGCRHAVNLGPPPSPSAAPGEAEARLRRVENFAFRLSYRTDSPFELGADFAGVRDSSDRESWRGSWWRGTERRSFTKVGDGPVQYELVGGDWSREPRGIESRIFDHIEQVLSSPGFEYLGAHRGAWRYRFTPRLPVLDPSGRKRISGELELDSRTGLLLRALGREEDGPARWELRLSRFNRAGRVSVPFVPAQELVLYPRDRVGRAELGHAVRITKRRLDALGRRHRLYRASLLDRARCGRLVLQLEDKLPGAVLELLLGPGRVELWIAEETDGPGTGPSGQPATPLPLSRDTGIPTGAEGSGRIPPSDPLEVGGDASWLLRPVSLLGGNADFEVRLSLQFTARPTLLFTGFPTSPSDGVPVLLVLDGRALDAARTYEGRVEFAPAGGQEFVSALAAVAALPATAGLVGR